MRASPVLVELCAGMLVPAVDAGAFNISTGEPYAIGVSRPSTRS